jgi:hypothetical protein
MAAAGTAGHADVGTTYLRGVGRDLFNLYFPKYAGVDKYGLPTYWHRVTITMSTKETTADAMPTRKSGRMS